MEKPCCKRCQSSTVVKRGFVRKKQRWLCKACGLNFIVGDGRCRDNQAQKALACLLVSLGLSFRAAGLVVGVVRNTVMEWFKVFADEQELPNIEGKLDVVEYDEMHHFIQSKKILAGSGKPQRFLLVQLDSSMSRWGIAAVPLLSHSFKE
jgi:transposase-like protein